MKTKKPKFKPYNLLTNLILSLLVLSVGVLCLAPIEDAAYTSGDDSNIYRKAVNGDGISLMFNVYWGTDEVYSILDILEKREVKATFFIGGCWADDNTACLKSIAEKGHEIGNHGYFHKEQNKLNLTQNRKEIEDCNSFISLAVGVKPVLFAPPSGAYNADTLTAVNDLRMKTILWSKDTIDWRDKNQSLIYTRATKNIEKGDFILMHPMKATVDALDDILKYYETKGLPVLTVSENLKGTK